MCGARRVVLRVTSNARRFRLTLSDGCCRETLTVCGGCDCVCFLTNADYITVAASPVSGEYYNKVFFRLDVRCRRCFELHAGFLRRPIDTESFNEFYLTDENYGLNIDGKLYFTGA